MTILVEILRNAAEENRSPSKIAVEQQAYSSFLVGISKKEIVVGFHSRRRE